MDIPPAQPPTPDGQGSPDNAPPPPQPWDATPTQPDAAAFAPPGAAAKPDGPPPAAAAPPDAPSAPAAPVPDVSLAKSPSAGSPFAGAPEPAGPAAPAGIPLPPPAPEPFGGPQSYPQPYPPAYPQPPAQAFPQPPAQAFPPPGSQAFPPPYAGPPGPPYAPSPYPGPPYAPTPYGANPYDMGGGPQGYWNPGWYQQPTTTNGLAIASLVVSVALTCLPLVGVILGIAGLRQIRRTGQSGRGLAIAGIVINGIGTLVAMLLIVLAVFSSTSGDTGVQDLRPGQCFNTVGGSLSDYSGAGHRSTRVDVVSCQDEHDAEAYAYFTLDPSYYPGVDRISQMSGERCSHLVPGYVGDAELPDGMGIYYYLPAHDAWDRGNRSVTCFFGSSGGRVTGSVATSDHGAGVGV